MSNKVLARALVKLALAEDKQIAINTADSSQGCGLELCDLSRLSEAESQEVNKWISLKVDEQLALSEEVKD